LGLLITAVTIWFLARTISAADLWQALRTARPLPIALGTLSILLTGLVKAWRWQVIFTPPTARPRLISAFQALMLNQMVNTVVIGRFGEIARIYYVNRSDGTGKARTLGTIVVEKSLDMLFTLLTVALILPWVILPHAAIRSAVVSPALTLALTTALLLIALWLFAFRSDDVVHLTTLIAAWLPAAIGLRLVGITRSGLQGMAGLRDRRSAISQTALSAVVALLYILTPWLLFAAFDLPFTFVHATLLHIWTAIAIAIPSTPGRIGVWEGVVIALLTQLAPELPLSLLLSYAIVFHLVVLVPPLILGTIAAVQSNWSRQAALSVTS
jgi:uncharacterized protein (TIRG00374 family)